MTVTVLRAPHLSVQGPQEAYLYIHEQTSSDARASPGKKGQATTVFTPPRLQSQDKQCQQLGMKEWHRLGALTDHCTLPAAAVQRFSLPSICSPSTQHHSQLSAGAGGSLLEPLDLVCPDMGQCWALLTEVISATIHTEPALHTVLRSDLTKRGAVYVSFSQRCKVGMQNDPPFSLALLLAVTVDSVAFGAQVQPCASALKQEVPSGSTSTKYKTNTTSSTCRETRGSVWPQINGTLSAATDGFSYKLKPEAGAGIRQQRSARDRCESLQRVTVLPTGGDGFLAEQQWALHWQP